MYRARPGEALRGKHHDLPPNLFFALFGNTALYDELHGEVPVTKPWGPRLACGNTLVSASGDAAAAR